ncbi:MULTISPECIES: KAP family P-loop NTPase fold protein [unclassified Psychrobacter]|uniref:KAP family P-loop NTPase fold protein n=1 Tax=unclassified Psychrobacter TaxID=196806 RepID=UPI0018F35307|nr:MULTISPECIES: P-loop NTPase fold protein [unclassified Psychrobacter]
MSNSNMKNYRFSDRDEFKRKPIAEKIIKLLDSKINVSPMIIDGKWGTGKTEFCFKLKNLIEANNPNNYKTSYVNAFQADHANEPLLTLIASVAGLYESENKEKFINKAIPYLRLVTGIGLKSGLSLVFGKYGSEISSDYTEGVEAIKEGSKELVDQSLKSIIKDQVKAEENLNALQATLLEITKENPVILLIDELDRCRPDFAVAMLETIKHVFDVENVQIILVTNAEQLKATIKHSYGSETDPNSYLYKFFKYQINLPTTSKDEENRSVDNNVTYFRQVVQESSVIPQGFKDNDLIYDVSKFVKVDQLSLRKIEQVVRCIETLIIFEDTEKSKSRKSEQILITFLCFLYISNYKKFINLSNKKITSSNFDECINNYSLTLMINGSSNNIEDYSAEFFILASFSSRVRSNLIRTNYTDKLHAFSMLVQTFDDKLNLKGLLIRSNHISPDRYLSEYINHTINNLLLFDIHN